MPSIALSIFEEPKLYNTQCFFKRSLYCRWVDKIDMQNNDWKRQYEMNCFAINLVWKMGDINYTQKNAYILNGSVLKCILQMKNLVISKVQARAGP